MTYRKLISEQQAGEHRLISHTKCNQARGTQVINVSFRDNPYYMSHVLKMWLDKVPFEPLSYVQTGLKSISVPSTRPNFLLAPSMV